jgi:hypothetical protein
MKGRVAVAMLVVGGLLALEPLPAIVLAAGYLPRGSSEAGFLLLLHAVVCFATGLALVLLAVQRFQAADRAPTPNAPLQPTGAAPRESEM